METTPLILKTIAAEINRNPLWAMLRALEYLEPEHPLFRAYAQKARKALAFLSYPELDEEQVAQILRGQLIENSSQTREKLRPQSIHEKENRVANNTITTAGSRTLDRQQSRRDGSGRTLTVKGRGGYTKGAGRSSAFRRVPTLALARW